MDADYILHGCFAIPCVLLESYISNKKFASATQSESKDRGTLFVIWMIIIASQVLSAHYIRVGYGAKIISSPLLKYALLVPLGASLYFLGMIIRKQAIDQLGQWFTTAVRVDKSQQLIDSGWYGRMRHPSYTGVLLYFLGLAFIFNNWLSLFGTMVPISLAFLYRIHVEEQALRKHFGVEHDRYRRKVPSILFPHVY